MMKSAADLVESMGRVLFDWILLLPPDLRIVVLAVLTSGCLLAARKLCTDQKTATLISADLRALKERLRAARRMGDKKAKERYTGNVLALRQRMMRIQLPAIAVVLVPLVLAGTWAQSRLSSRWPGPGEEVSVTLSAPEEHSGRLVYLAADGGLKVLRPVNRFGLSGRVVAETSAEWRLQPLSEGDVSTLLVFRSGDETVSREVVARKGAFIGCGPVVHSNGWSSSVTAPESLLFGRLPGISAVGLPGWVSGYLLVVLLSYPVFRKLFRVE